MEHKASRGTCTFPLCDIRLHKNLERQLKDRGILPNVYNQKFITALVLDVVNKLTNKNANRMRNIL